MHGFQIKVFHAHGTRQAYNAAVLIQGQSVIRHGIGMQIIKLVYQVGMSIE